MIYPSLFIGIGSTGLEILQQLQELVFEHYGKPSLDVFEYLAIESKETAEVKSTIWGDNHIKLLRPTIGNTDVIARELEKGNKPELDRWLSRELLKLGGRDYKDGASNIRMAGRLILWENWTEIKRSIDQAVAKIKGDPNKASTRSFLRDHYRKHNQPIDSKDPLIGDLPNIYLCGTICGGTCGGMFIDLAYYVKQVSGLWQKDLSDPLIAKVFGVFSAFDHSTLTNTAGGLSQHAGNSWAALTEYDFYCYTQTRYSNTFPGGTDNDKVDTNERPVDVLYLLSCTASTPRFGGLESNFRSPDGKADVDSLNHAAATLIFSETVGGMLGAKEAIRTDYRSNKRNIESNAGHHSPCISTCGIAVVWYPKYRIAHSAACRRGRSICRQFIAEADPDTQARLKAEAGKTFFDIITRAEERVIATPKGTLYGEVKNRFASHSAEWLAKKPEAMKTILEGELKKLSKNEYYDSKIVSQIGDFEKSFATDLRSELIALVNNERNILHALYWLKQIDSELAAFAKRLTAEFPDPDFKKARPIGVDLSARLVLVKRRVQQELGRDLLEDVEAYIVDRIKRIRNYRLLSMIDSLHEEIGIRRQLSDRRVSAGQTSLSQGLEQARDRLVDCSNLLKDEYDRLSDEKTVTQDVILVYQRGSLQSDVDSLADTLETAPRTEQDEILNSILQGKTLSQFLGLARGSREAAEIGEDIRTPLLKVCLQRVGRFDVAKAVNAMPQSDVAAFARHALPHMELSRGHSGLASEQIGRDVAFVAGANKAELDILLDSTLKGTECDSVFKGQLSPTIVNDLSHMVIFYQEEPLMYMDENLATAAEFRVHYNKASESGTIGLHTDKGGPAIFDPSRFYREGVLKSQLMPLALKIFSKRDTDGGWESSDVFGVERGELIYRGQRRDRSKARFTGDEEGIRVCAADPELFDILTQLVQTRLEELTKEQFIDKLNAYIDYFETTLGDDEDKSKVILEEQNTLKNLPMVKECYDRAAGGKKN